MTHSHECLTILFDGTKTERTASFFGNKLVRLEFDPAAVRLFHVCATNLINLQVVISIDLGCLIAAGKQKQECLATKRKGIWRSEHQDSLMCIVRAFLLCLLLGTPPPPLSIYFLPLLFGPYRISLAVGQK
jgi:hypothetical protein